MKWLSPFSKELENRFDNFREELSDLFDRFFPDRLVKSERSAGTFFPVVNVKEEPEKYVVEVEVPGVDPDEMEIELKGSILIIKGEKKFEKESDEDEIHLIERRYGAFRRTLTLPDNILADEITAKNKNGVLYISIPKGKEKDSKKIRIENGNIA